MIAFTILALFAAAQPGPFPIDARAGGVDLVHTSGVTRRFSMTVLDENTPNLLPCRIHLKDASGRPVHPPVLPSWNDHFVCPGRVDLELAPGEYSYVIQRGPEYESCSGKFIFTGAPLDLTNRLHRLVDLSKEGWWSGELHVHRILSDIEMLMRAEDLHIAPVITWWNARNLWSRESPPQDLLIQFDENRFYHLMGGEDERGGGALLFLNLRQPLPITAAKYEHPSSMQFLLDAKRQPDVWIDIEKPFWYDVPVWLASGQADSIGIANNHMQQAMMYPNEAWGRPRDKTRLPDPLGNGYWTQEIYYHALNCGLRIPPSAGSASGVLKNPLGYNRVYVHLDGPPGYQKWFEGLRAGQSFVSNGPLLRCRANGKLPGHVFTIKPGEELKITLEATLDSRDRISSIEIIKNGRIQSVISTEESKSKTRLGEISFQESGWFLVRVIADVPETFRFASTAPFYVEAAGKPDRISKSSARFFLDWVQERISQLKLDNPSEREEVLKFHREAERFWKAKLEQANAE